MVVFTFEGREFRSLRSLRDHLSLNFSRSEALRYFSDHPEIIERLFYRYGQLVSVSFYEVYYCSKRNKFIIRVTY